MYGYERSIDSISRVAFEFVFVIRPLRRLTGTREREGTRRRLGPQTPHRHDDKNRSRDFHIHHDRYLYHRGVIVATTPARVES